ncbi:ExbD/TolR family protein [Tepidamorphus sp. 3E244]|uniref:ExbD/TolR family protein n=1 Tax=Tepidamorphus sp. 3E244 TaxID=3385498 RepID=UPI0038FC913F
MRFAATTPRKRLVNITPLIDVIFLLVLFFLLASVFARNGEIDISARVPGNAVQSDLQTVLVRVGEGGALDINGRPVEREALFEAIGEASETRVVLLARPGSTMQDFVTMLDRIQQAGFPVVTGSAQ